MTTNLSTLLADTIHSIRDINRERRRLQRLLDLYQQQYPVPSSVTSKISRSAQTAAVTILLPHLDRHQPARQFSNTELNQFVQQIKQVLLENQERLEQLLKRYEKVHPERAQYGLNLSERMYEFICGLYELLEEPGEWYRKSQWLSRYYDSTASLILVGYNKSFKGATQVADSLLRKYAGLTIRYQLTSIRIDFPGMTLINPPLFIATINGKIQINEDEPRKIQQIFDIVKPTASTGSYELDMVIRREMFIVQDSRPLYHWPEIDTPGQVEIESIISRPDSGTKDGQNRPRSSGGNIEEDEDDEDEDEEGKEDEDDEDNNEDENDKDEREDEDERQ